VTKRWVQRPPGSMMPRWLAAVPEIIHVEVPDGFAPVSEASEQKP